jgi:hypothetical protein
MWVKVDDGFPEHEKVLEAGRHLGPYGPGRVVAVWLAGMCYCNRNLTDGFVRESIVRTWIIYDKRPLDVATVMALQMPDGKPGLLERVEGGFRFHDYHHYQPSKDEVIAKRQRDLDRKKKGRADKDSARNSVGVSAESSPIPSLPDPGPSRPASTHTTLEDHGAVRRGFPHPVENLRVLKAVIWAEVQAGLNAGETHPGDLKERVKEAAARARVDYAQPESREYLHDQFDLAIKRLKPQPQRRTA